MPLPRSLAAPLTAPLAAALLALPAAAAPAAAQSVAVACARADAGGCASLRFTLGALGAPWIVETFSARLAAGWAFRPAATDARTTVRGLDSFWATPFTATAARPEPGRALVEFLVSPGVSFELPPGESGYLELDVSGSGALDVAFAATDADGVTTAGAASIVSTPEPSALALAASGLAALGAVARRRRGAPARGAR